MARGKEDFQIVDAFLKEFTEANEFLEQIVPCIIPNDEVDGKILEDGLKVVHQLNQFIKECDGDMAELDELFDIDKIVSEYPKIAKLFSQSGNNKSGSDFIERYLEEN